MSSAPTSRGRPHLNVNGFLFQREKNSACGAFVYWRCSLRSLPCRARVKTKLDHTVVSAIPDHSHDPSPARTELLQARSNVLERAETTQETPSQLLGAFGAQLSEPARLQAPSKAALFQMVKRRRLTKHVPPVSPSNLASLIIPEHYTTYNSSPGVTERFLQYDCGTEDRILIFARDSLRQRAPNVTTLYVDGTFSITPSLFAQCFVILGECGSEAHPVCYCLLPNKTELTYRRLFTQLVQLWPSLYPSTIYTDFETALFKAVTHVFPRSEVAGCLFHLKQNIRRKMGQLRLIKKAAESSAINLSCQCVAALAYVPPDAVDHSAAILKDAVEPEVLPLVQYFVKTYIGPRALFPREMWSVYSRTRANVSRTNNFCESSHRRLQQQFGATQPTLWRFIDKLRKAQHCRDLEISQNLTGTSQRGRSLPRYRVDVAQRIDTLVASWGPELDPLQYLQAIASCRLDG